MLPPCITFSLSSRKT